MKSKALPTIIITAILILPAFCATAQTTATTSNAKVSVSFTAKYECCDTAIIANWRVTGPGTVEAIANGNDYSQLCVGQDYVADLTYIRDGYIWDCPVLNYRYDVPGTYKETLTIPKLTRFIDTDAPWSNNTRYMDCGGLCNGYKVDYYDNGNKRLEGSFIEGRPVGKVAHYNEDHTVKYIEIYNKKGKCKKTSPGMYTSCCGPKANVRRALGKVVRE